MLFLYYCFIKPIVVFICFVIMPGLIRGTLKPHVRPHENARYPSRVPLPETSSFFLLQWHPELKDTRVGAYIRLQMGDPGADPRAEPS